ncbi:hypothetical protein [Oscillatoria sp. HE19RPO]|uniref:hypothetical protein n=1 Tax=Oscillatoria sp. HE19RPO TaxID=2954806 RepID=UPI0020C33D65|nr:hypothetical protein [Oscillatoria sp. HE19RPO]
MTYSMFDKNNMHLVDNYVREIQDSITSNDQLIPTISYWSLQKSISNLQALPLFYFPLHGLSEVDFTKFMPLFIFIEATIYQIDEEYENNIDNPQFISQHISVLQNVLTQLNLFDEKIDNELKEGLIYYSLEQKFCSGLIPTEESIYNASLYKCFDFGILQRILLKLIREPYNEEFLSICQTSVQISKICTDIEDYHRDINRNVINTYRMFVRLYGTAAPHQLLRFINELNTNLQQKIGAFQKNNPNLAQHFVELRKKILEDFRPISSNTDPIDGLILPEIPEPILES